MYTVSTLKSNDTLKIELEVYSGQNQNAHLKECFINILFFFGPNIHVYL